MHKVILTFKKKIALVGVLALTLVAIFVGVQQLISIYDQGDLLLPPLPQHADVGKQPLLTYAQSLKTPFPTDARALPASGCATQSGEWLRNENTNFGAAMDPTTWHNMHLFIPTGSVLWTNQMSATCGAQIKVHASAFGGDPADTNARTIKVYRIGYYNGAEAREVWSSSPIKLKRYNVPKVKSLTRMVETLWPVTATFTIGRDWTPGLYAVATVNDKDIIENLSPLIVKAAAGSSKLLLVHSTITWAAYNSFGGRSAYIGPINSKRERSRVVSMDRPLLGSGINHFDRDGIALVQYLEQSGISVDQIADTDLDRNPSILTHYSGVIFSGHAEYMTNRIFKSILAARSNGINLAFLGSNTAYWQVRLESSPSGSDRRVAIYRDPQIDPITSPSQITIQFLNPRINMQPSLITGEVTAGVHVVGDMTVQNKPSWLSLPQGAHLNGWSPNTEIDSVVKNISSPDNTHIIFSGKFKLTRFAKSTPSVNQAILNRSYEGQTLWFTTPSGSAVFVAGVNYWACELSYTCMESNTNEETRSTLKSVTSQVLNLWQTRGIGRSLK